MEVKQDVKQYPYERAQRFGVSQRGVGYASKRLGISYKKTFSPPKADESAREGFLERIEAYQSAQREIVYLDESGFANDRPRR